MNKSYSLISPSWCTDTYRRRRRSQAGRSHAPWRRLASEPLETRRLLAADLLHNAARPTDVNADGYTSPMDALHVINELNLGGARSLAAHPATASSGLFYDVNADDFVTPVDALLVLNELNGEGDNHDLVQIRLQTTDADGNPISTIDAGQQFQLRAYVQDLTAREDGGVFAAYVDVEYNSDLVALSGDTPLSHGPSYGNAVSGNLATLGLMDEVGSIDGLAPLGESEFLLFTVAMTAASNGTANFVADPADLSPAHDVLIYGIPEGETSSIVPSDRIAYINTTLQIGSVTEPQAVDDNYEVAVDGTLTVDVDNGVLANDVNPGAGEMTATLMQDVANGELTLAADGSFTYTPEGGFVGQDTFTYVATVGDVSSNVATVTIAVVTENSVPVAVADEYSMDEGGTLTIDPPGVLANDTDADGDDLTAELVTEPTNGTLTLNANGSFTYTPDANFSGTDTFEYLANDGTADSTAASVTITVNAENDPPVAVDDGYAGAPNTTLTIAAPGVLANDTDADDDELTAELVTDTANGTLTLAADGSFTYVPDADFVGQDTFTYVASDGMDTSDPATVTITITGTTQAQVRIRLEIVNALGDPITAIGPGGEFTLNVYVQDVSDVPRDGVFAAYMDILFPAALADVNGPITFSASYPNQQRGDTSVDGVIDEAGAFDGLQPLGDGELLLLSVPMVAESEGTAIFASERADQLPAHDVLLFNESTPVATNQIDYGLVELDIVSGEAPVAVDDEYETDEDVELVVDAANGVLANDTDADSDTLSAILVADPANGTVELNADGSFRYQPNPDFFGTDTFTYQATDGAQTSTAATVTIVVNPLDDPPIAVDDTYQTPDMVTLTVDAANGVLANDSEPDGETMTAVLETGPENGVLELNPDGSFTYTPNDGFAGRDTFTYRAVSNETESNVATVSIDVGDLNPSSIVGFVYGDANNNGQLDTGEGRYGNVRITLVGEDLFGRPVEMETRTGADGSYRFDEVLRGNYTVTEFQPMGLVDGKDMVGNQPSLRNDRFLIDLPAGEVVGDYNFGERGLSPLYIRDPLFFASRTTHGLLAMMNQAGGMEWYCLDDTWLGLNDVDVELSTNRTTAEVTIEDASGGSDTSQIALNTNRNARLMDPGGEGALLRLSGDPEDFGLVPIADGAELDAAAVDAAFGGDDA